MEAKRKVVERLQSMQPDQFKYQIIYTDSSEIKTDDLQPVINWTEDSNG